MMHIDTSDRREQRKFGLLMAAAIAVLGLLRYALHGFEHFPVYFFAVAAVFLALGLAAPIVLKPVFIAWMKFAVVLNWIVTHILLTVAWCVMFTPVRVLVSIFSEDPLKRAWKAGGASYWEPPEEQPDKVERYFNQF